MDKVGYEARKRWLSSLPPEQLADWLSDVSMRYHPLEVVLDCEHAQFVAGGLDFEALRAAIEALTTVPDRTTWREAEKIGAKIGMVIGLLTRVWERGQAAAVVTLAELALHRVEVAVMEVQDSEFWSKGILEEISNIHRKACLSARPDPVGLATRWLQFRLRSPLDLHGNFPVDYAEVLGKPGLDALNALVEDALGGLSKKRLPSNDWELAKLMSIREELQQLRYRPI